MAEANATNKEEHINAAKLVQQLADEDGKYEAPINLDLRRMQTLALRPLSWYNYDVCPKKMKITNTGHTVIVSGKWGRHRPFIRGGPLMSKGYVFSQLHFHWGSNTTEGSEHTVEGHPCPMEMHVVHFKSSYLTQESAMKEKDGIAIMVYLFKLQHTNNPDMEVLSRALPHIRYPQTSAKVDPLPMSFVIRPFNEDYFLYWGTIKTTNCSHVALWFVSRQPIGVSNNQLALYRSLTGLNHRKLLRNYRKTRPLNNRTVFHVLPSTWLTHTLLPVPKRGTSSTGERRASQAAPTPSPFDHGDDVGNEELFAFLNDIPVHDEGLSPEVSASATEEDFSSPGTSKQQT